MGASGEIPADFEYDKQGQVVLAPERFKNAQEIIQCCDEMITADQRRVPWRASIDGLFNGNPTYRLSWLKAKKQGWRARCNYRGLEGLIQARQTPFFDLVTEIDPCIEVSLDFGKGVEQADWANAIAKSFHWMLMKLWRSSFNYHVPLQQLEMLKHGLGCHVWPGNKNHWIPRTPLSGMVLFPDGISLNLREDMDYFMLRDFVPGYALYQHIKNPEAATRLGWNVNAVWSALAQSSKQQWRGIGTDRFTIETLQREFKSGDIGTTTSRQSGVWLNHLFVKEIDSEKISQYTVAEGTVSVQDKRKKTDPWSDCLFRKRERFDEWPLVIFPYDIGGDGQIHSLRGLGARTKDFFELSNRIKNAMADQVLVGSTMPLKQTGDVDPDRLRLWRLGVMSIIPRGLDVAQGVQFPPLAQGPIAFDQLLERTLHQNNESYMQGTPEAKDRETAQSITMRMQNSGQVAKGVHSLYASNYQQMLERIFRIAASKAGALGNSLSARLAKQFQDRCAQMGVPEEALANVYEVNEVFSTGAGSPAARIDALTAILKVIYPTTTEERKINIERDFVAAYTCGSKVDRYARSQSDNQLPNDDVSLAVQENNGMMQGGKATASPSQDHVKHLQTHLQQAEQVAGQAMQGQMNPAQALGIIQAFGNHTAEHLRYLQQNPMRKPEFDQLHKQWLSLSVIADKLNQQVQAMQQAEAQQPPQEKVSDNLKIGMQKVAASERIGMAKVQSKARIDVAKTMIDGRIAAMQSRNGARKAA